MYKYLTIKISLAFAVIIFLCAPALSQYDDLKDQDQNDGAVNLVVCYYDEPRSDMFKKIVRRLFSDDYDILILNPEVGIIQTDYNTTIDKSTLQIMPSLSFYFDDGFIEIKGKYKVDATGGFWGGDVKKNLYKPDIISNVGGKKKPAQRAWRLLLSQADICKEVEVDKV